MVSPFIKSPLGGNLGLRTGSFFRLDPTGTVPVEPLGDLVPGLNGNRIVVDALDSETKDSTYLITTNALQDFTSAQTNNHKEPVRITVTGILISSIDLGLVGSTGVAGIPGFGGGLRADLLKIDNLERLADRREPIMYVSPRVDLAKAFIESISRSWDPGLGDNTQISVSLVEARIVNPLLGDAATPDVEASATGNNAPKPAGAQGGKPVQTQSVTNSVTLGVAPQVTGGAVPL
jgi:hypothetical protein